MKQLYFALLAVAIAPACFGQGGTDINDAIPVYFNQKIMNTIDGTTLPRQVYSITLAKGQQLSATVTATKGNPPMYLYLYSPSTTTVVRAGNGVASNSNYGAATFTYQVSTAGVYYVDLETTATSVPYTFQVTAQGTPIGIPNPTQSGCVSGQVQSIVYSLDLIAAGLPDSVTIGGTQLCATCTLKPPAYTQIVDKLEKAMGLALPVQACYDGTGSIFQITLNHQ